MVLESEGRHLAGIEIKAAATVTATDFEVMASFGDRLFAVPIRTLWEAP